MDPPPSAHIQLFYALDGREIGSGNREAQPWHGDETQATVTGIQVLIAEDWQGGEDDARMVAEVTDGCGTTQTVERGTYLSWAF